MKLSELFSRANHRHGADPVTGTDAGCIFSHQDAASQPCWHGLDPLLVGVLSDLFSPHYGERGLSVALAYFTLAGLWGSLRFWLCGRALAKQGSVT